MELGSLRSRLHRRAALACLAAPWLPGASASESKGAVIDSEWRRYPDPATEFEVLRLTNPDFESRLAADPLRVVSRKGDLVVYASRRGGAWQAYAMELKKGTSRQLTAAADLDPTSVGLFADDRAVHFIDAGTVKSVQLSSLRETELAPRRDPFRITSAVPSPDITLLFYAESNASTTSLRRVRLARPGAAEPVLDLDGAVSTLLPNPRRATLAWVSASTLWVARYDGGGRRRIQTPPGQVVAAEWSPDGNSLIYLLAPAEPAQLATLHEQNLDSLADKPIAKTSQFACFTANLNASVFLGASRSKASPHVLLLLRSTRRELTLAEHRASDPSRVSPQFSPTSQRVFFESDRHGNWALYSVVVDRLIEKTET